MAKHFVEHMTLEYASRMMKAVDTAIEQVAGAASERYADDLEAADTMDKKLSVVDMMRMKDPELGRKVDKLLAAASGTVLAELTRVFEKIGPMAQQLAQQAQQFKPPMPMDPTQATLQAATLATGAQKEITATREQGQTQRTELQIAADQAIENRKLDQKDIADKAGIAQDESSDQTRHQMNIEDNQTALTIAEADLAVGNDKVSVSTGTGLNP